jgi:chromosome segregation ATPase
MMDFLAFLRDHVTEKFPREAIKLETMLQKVHNLLEEIKKHLGPLDEARAAYEDGVAKFVQQESQSIQNAITDMNKKLDKEFYNKIRAAGRDFLQAELKRNENDFAELKQSCKETRRVQAEMTLGLDSMKNQLQAMQQQLTKLQQDNDNLVQDAEELNARLCKTEAAEHYWWERAGRPHIPGVTE